MIGASIRKLCGSYIQDPFPGASRDQVNKAEQILTGVTETHASSDTGFIVLSAAGHIESDHALVLIPDIDHSVNFRAAAGDMEAGEKPFPVFIQMLKSLYN